MSLTTSKNQWPLSNVAAEERVTLKDIARLADCSTAVASTVLNHSRGNTGVSDSLRQRVLAIAQEHNYRPHLSARSMKSRKSHIVGVLVRNNSRLSPHELAAHPFVWDFLLGINEGLEEAGYLMSLVRLSDVDPGKYLQSTAFQGHLLDGLIVVNHVPATSPEHLKMLVPRCVWLDTNVWHSLNCVRRDEKHAGYLAMESLLELGYREIEVIGRYGDALEHYSYSQRHQGIAEAAKRWAAEKVEQEAKIKTSLLPWHGVELEATLERLARRVRPDVALLTLDIYASHTIASAMVEKKLCAGHDFALACCDDSSEGAKAWPQLSRVSFNRVDMGLQTARRMIHQLEEPGEPCPSVLFRGHWIKGSTALPCKDKLKQGQ